MFYGRLISIYYVRNTSYFQDLKTRGMGMVLSGPYTNGTDLVYKRTFQIIFHVRGIRKIERQWVCGGPQLSRSLGP